MDGGGLEAGGWGLDFLCLLMHTDAGVDYGWGAFRRAGTVELDVGAFEGEVEALSAGAGGAVGGGGVIGRAVVTTARRSSTTFFRHGNRLLRPLT